MLTSGYHKVGNIGKTDMFFFRHRVFFEDDLISEPFKSRYEFWFLKVKNWTEKKSCVVKRCRCSFNVMSNDST